MSAAVRRATRADVPAIARTLARAFYDDPVYRWMFPDERRRLDLNRRFLGVRARQVLAQDETYVAGDGARAAALWTLPGRWHTTRWEDLALTLPVLGAVATRLRALMAGFGQMEAAHPREPHLYLAVLGTDPAHQGRGLGGAVLGPMLDVCDTDGLPAYLESSKQRNLAFYARFGFRVTGEVPLGSGPPVWTMWREPR